MKVLPRVLYLAAFLGMAVAGALALDRALQPSMSTDLLRSVIMGGVLGAAGLVHRKAWGVSLVLLPVGAYILFRVVLPPGDDVQGASGLYHFYTQALAIGGEQYSSKYFPLSLTGAGELRLLMATVVYCLVGLAAFFSLSLRQPVAGVALVLLLLGFSFTVDTVSRVLALALVFLVLAACVLVLSRSLERQNWRLRDAIPGVLVGGAGAALAVLLLGAAPSAAAAPWQDWRTWNPFGQGSSIYSFNWLQNYPQLLNPANNTVIMKVESSKPSYWRANALDDFSGEAWISSQGWFSRDIDVVQEDVGYVYSIPTADPTPPGTIVTQEFRVRSVYTNYFFTGGDPRALTMATEIAIRTNDMRSLHVVNALGPSIDYTLEAVIPNVMPDSLVGLGRGYPDEVQAYVVLPFQGSGTGGSEEEWLEIVNAGERQPEQWLGLYSLNRTIVGEATDPYEIALRLERHLRANYRYTLEPPDSGFSSPYAAFLFDTRAGYCQHFAGAMALLLRFNGIPARVAVGFTSGELESPGVYSVTTNNAHAWVEAYFPTVGWTAFDPTPGRSVPYAGASSTSPGFEDPFASAASGATTGVTEAPDPFPGRNPGSSGSSEETGGAGWISSVPWLPWLIGVIVVVAAWPFGRRLWRERELRRGTLSRRFAASLRLSRTSLTAYGVAVTGSSTFEDVVGHIEEHLGLSCEPVLAARAAAVLFGGRHARTEDLERAEHFRREVEAGLRRRHGWGKTLLAWYGLPPMRRRRAGTRPSGAGTPSDRPGTHPSRAYR